jgi:ribosome biogenesis GTPase A
MHPQEVAVAAAGRFIRLIDTPGLFWEYPEDASEEDAVTLKARDVLLRSRGRIDHLKDPLPPCTCWLRFVVDYLFTSFLSEPYYSEC